MATKIILHRKSEFTNRARGIKVLIDGMEVGKIANGSSDEYAVYPGVHAIQCKIDWCSSPVIDLVINADESKFLKVGSGMKYFSAGYILLLLAIGSDLLLKFAGIPKPVYLWWIKLGIIIPIILYLLYYLIVGRKNYLQLKEDTDNIFS